ncbi:MAG: hypothetical protein JO173_01970, partial [Gammaproteobacteria bacterium]|nr:hypothetical protein [Gammaproteobacteria bacterium]
DADPGIAASLRGSAAAPDLWPLWSALARVPMLAIRGANSDLLSAATLARMQREKPDLEALTVANRGHPPRLDEPECVAAIEAFLRPEVETFESARRRQGAEMQVRPAG